MSDERHIRDPEDLPALYQAANARSLSAQTSFLFWYRARLFGLLLAAAGGALAHPIWGISIGGWLAVAAFTAALVSELVVAILKPDKTWYEGRAAAESAKTLSWRFMTSGAKDGAGQSDTEAQTEFLAELKDLLHDLGDLELATTGSGDTQITKAMNVARRADFPTRKALYKSCRIEDQRLWYEGKAAWNARRWRQWTAATVAAEGVGVIVGLLVAVGTIRFDALAIVAAIAATMTAWVQAKQHQNLSTAYSIASQEIAAIKSEIDLIDESKWAEFVAQSEEAISREHTLWRASKGAKL